MTGEERAAHLLQLTAHQQQRLATETGEERAVCLQQGSYNQQQRLASVVIMTKLNCS